jgi:hypothetical protein
MNETTNGLPVTGFSYDGIEAKMVVALKESARRIKSNINIASASFIEVGHDLITVKEQIGHGRFTGWIELEFGMNYRAARRIMSIARTFKTDKLSDLKFPQQVLLELAKADEPQEALAEANERKEAGETLTAKQAKEIAELQRQVADAFKSAQPDLKKLIPELERLHRFDEIPETTALEFSKLDESVQRLVVLPKFQDVKRLRQDIEKLNAEKNRALEKESKARENAERLEADLQNAVESGTEELLKRKDEEIARKELELNQLKVDMRDKIEREQTEILRKQFKDEHARVLAEKQKEIEKLTRKLADSEESVTQCSSAELFERAQKEKAQAQLAAIGPMEKDAYHARKIRFLTSDVKAIIEKIESDCEPYQRQQSIKELREFREIVQRFLGSSLKIIDI